MDISTLQSFIQERKSFLCVGLDTDIKKIPSFLLSFDDPIFEFNKRIIDATKEYCVAYKLNSAFYEAMGSGGWESMRKTFYYIGDSHFKIADAKRGDIGNTCDYYAKAFFEEMNADAITIAPYMGRDSVNSFLQYPGKFSILLALTSNESATDFELVKNESGKELYKTIIEKSSQWGSEENMMYVVGATKSEMISEIRKIIPNHFLLVPGVGAQGGSLHEVVTNGMNKNCGLLINASRSIIYAGNGDDFQLQAALEANKLQQEMASYL